LSLTPGTRLGVYDITAPIGEGGMGQVYRATDTTLGRNVAIKILPDAFENNPERLARFEREAKTLASLNHPHIAAIYGFEKSAGMHALVMEFVEGEDLSRRIAGRAIPIDEALPIAKQIAEALEAAHQQGIIHRDLKPANIKVRADGTVKVLDFGLAKAMEPAADSSPSLSLSPTITTPAMTHAGMILGTAAYMSPEQARGKTLDRRTDIWAFGAVLYEMLTGKRAFGGDGVQDTLAAIMRDEPDWARLPATLSPALATFIRRCLHKDPKQRIHDIADVRLALEGAFEAVVSHAAPAARPTSAVARAMSWVSSAAALVFAIAWLTVWVAWRAERPVDRPLVWLDVDLGTDVSLPDPTPQGSSVAISPDGTRLAWLSGTPTKLFTRRLDEPKAIELPGTEAALAPFFSPDGQWVGFFSLGRVNKISVEGGAVVPLGDISFVGASWGQDGSIFVGQFAKGLLRIPDGGGPPETVLGVGVGELALAAPQILPGGRAILFVADPGLDVDKVTIEVLTLADGKRKVVARGGQSPRYLATSDRTGHLVYVNRATLFAVPFDLDTLEARGTAVPVLDDVAYAGSVGTGHFDVSRTGTLVYRRAGGGAARLTTVQWVDPLGKKESLLAKPGLYGNVILSPDGTRVALTVSERGTRYDVWVYDLERDIMTRLTFDGFNSSPTWSPDGRYVLFSQFSRGIFQARADGASRPQALMPSKITQFPRSFMPDGKRLAYVDNGSGERNAQIWTVALEEQDSQWTVGTPEPFLKSSVADQAPSFSPDGRWLAYHSNESGTNEVFVRAFPPSSSGQGGKWQISNSGGTVPRWSRSARELVYQMGDQIMAARYAVNGDTFVAEKPRVWIAKLGGTEWDLAADGKRVVVVTPVASAEAPKQEHQVVFVQNFFDELRRRVPLGK